MHIYLDEIDALKTALEEFKDKETTTVKIFKYEVMFCFWFAIHMENVKAAQLIYKIDHVIESIMKNLRASGEDIILLKRNDDKKRERREQLKKAIVKDESFESDDEEGSEGSENSEN